VTVAATTTGTISPAAAEGTKTAIPAAVIGTVLEWYDFAVYAYVAGILASQFFSKENPTAGLLSAFATFGLGFVARPLGGLVIGRAGDAVGRKPALLFTFVLMAIATAAIGVIPNYAEIGVLAPILLLVCRLAQGFAAGGEWGSSTAFIAEWAPHGRRGFLASLQQTSVVGGLLLGSGVTALMHTLFSGAQMESWGWRVPFLLGILLLPVGVYMRQNVGETPAYHEKRSTTPPAGSLWAAAWRAFGFTILWTVAFYILLAYMPTFTQKYGGLSPASSLWSNTIGLFVAAVAIPIFGSWSDRAGRKPLLLVAGVGFLVLTYPLFAVVTTHPGLGAVIVVQIIFALLIGFYSGAGPAAICELFPTLGRSMWMSASYSLAVAIFGGFAPFIATWLIARTGSPLAPTYYLIASAIVTTIVFLRLRETAFEQLA
jgi:MHS family proline/betaine transporter-like MFS transporter